MRRNDKPKGVDWFARIMGLIALLFTVFTWWQGERTKHSLEGAYFNAQLGPIDSLAAGVTPAALLEIKNTGRSRAKIDRVRASMLVAESDVAAFHRMEELMASQPPTKSELNPDGKYSSMLKLGHMIGTDEFSEMQRKAQNVYVVGDVDYWDAFDAHLRFSICHYYDLERAAWVGCSIGNETRKVD